MGTGEEENEDDTHTSHTSHFTHTHTLHITHITHTHFTHITHSRKKRRIEDDVKVPLIDSTKKKKDLVYSGLWAWNTYRKKISSSIVCVFCIQTEWLVIVDVVVCVYVCAVENEIIFMFPVFTQLVIYCPFSGCYLVSLGWGDAIYSKHAVTRRAKTSTYTISVGKNSWCYNSFTTSGTIMCLFCWRSPYGEVQLLAAPIAR